MKRNSREQRMYRTPGEKNWLPESIGISVLIAYAVALLPASSVVTPILYLLLDVIGQHEPLSKIAVAEVSCWRLDVSFDGDRLAFQGVDDHTGKPTGFKFDASWRDFLGTLRRAAAHLRFCVQNMQGNTGGATQDDVGWVCYECFRQYRGEYAWRVDECSDEKDDVI